MLFLPSSVYDKAKNPVEGALTFLVCCASRSSISPATIYTDRKISVSTARTWDGGAFGNGPQERQVTNWPTSSGFVVTLLPETRLFFCSIVPTVSWTTIECKNNLVWHQCDKSARWHMSIGNLMLLRSAANCSTIPSTHSWNDDISIGTDGWWWHVAIWGAICWESQSIFCWVFRFSVDAWR